MGLQASGPADPAIWFCAMLRAVAGLQRGDPAHATEYLRFVQAHRGRPAAEHDHGRLRTYRDAARWAEAGKMLAAQYQARQGLRTEVEAAISAAQPSNM